MLTEVSVDSKKVDESTFAKVARYDRNNQTDLLLIVTSSVQESEVPRPDGDILEVVESLLGAQEGFNGNGSQGKASTLRVENSERLILLSQRSIIVYSAMAMTDIDTLKSIAVGDSLLHDIKGANAHGIESAFITCRIHSSALRLEDLVKLLIRLL
ncbi:haloacid dehalogenase-like hydrolase superfamily protein [Tanacetum coccineum]